MNHEAGSDGGALWSDADDGVAARRCRSLLSALEGAVFHLDADGALVEVDDDFVESTGFARSALDGAHVSRVLDDDHAGALEGALDDHAPGEALALDVTAETASGARFDAEVRVTPLEEDGRRAGAVGLLRAAAGDSATVDGADGTGDTETEEQLRWREEQLSRLMDNIPGMVYRCENERGWPMEFVSEGCRSLTGYDPTALVSGDVSYGRDLVVEADRDDLWEEVQSKVDDRASFSITYRIETADGETRWVTDHGRGIFEDGDVVGIEGVITDVTERKRVEAELEESERRYRTIFEQFPNGAVALFDDDLRYTAAGGSAFAEIGDAAADVVGQTIHERYPEELAATLEPKYRAALDGEAADFEFEFHDRVWQAHTHPIEDDGDVSDGLIMVQDVTERRERERALERSEQRYRTLVDNFPNGAVALVDEDLRYQTIGGSPPEGIDAAREELVGETVREALPADLAERLAAAYEAAFEGESMDFEYEGGGRVYRFYTVPVRDDDGDVFAAMGMSQDVTEQKAQERRLRDAKGQLEAATEAANIGTWEWHVPDDEFVAGASLAKIFGVDPEAAREGVPIERMTASIHEDDRERVEAKIQETLDDCGEYEAEYRVRDADGEVRWVFARGHVDCDEDGDPVSFPGALADITERKRAEQELQQQRNQLETLFDVLPVGVVVADADGGILQANDTAAAIWGGDVFDADCVDEYDRYPVREADTGEPVPPEEMTLARVVDGEEVTEPDVYEIDAFDGATRVVRLEGRPIRDAAGEVTRGVVTLTDITERRRYQKQLEESNERLEQFAYAASHDLQEPLRMVSSYLSLVERRYGDELDADAQEFLEFAVDGADRMRDMIDGLLEYSRVETRGDPFEPVDLDDVLADVREDVKMRIEETGAEITSADLPTVQGDVTQLRQVFQNLLRNALEYSGDGPPRVHVDSERDGDEWVVAVEDEGIGIDPADADRVFEVFQRLHSREEHEGTGIGLALCRRIVERHGGEIWVESTPGEGSTFYFTLPVEVERDG